MTWHLFQMCLVLIWEAHNGVSDISLMNSYYGAHQAVTRFWEQVCPNKVKQSTGRLNQRKVRQPLDQCYHISFLGIVFFLIFISLSCKDWYQSHLCTLSTVCCWCRQEVSLVLHKDYEQGETATLAQTYNYQTGIFTIKVYKMKRCFKLQV